MLVEIIHGSGYYIIVCHFKGKSRYIKVPTDQLGPFTYSSHHNSSLLFMSHSRYTTVRYQVKPWLIPDSLKVSIWQPLSSTPNSLLSLMRLICTHSIDLASTSHSIHLSPITLDSFIKIQQLCVQNLHCGVYLITCNQRHWVVMRIFQFYFGIMLDPLYCHKMYSPVPCKCKSLPCEDIQMWCSIEGPHPT